MGRTVLIVDDHAAFRAAAGAPREPGDCEVVGEAEDGAPAIAAAVALRPEIVLLDIHLPDLDGFAVAERARGPLAHRRGAFQRRDLPEALPQPEARRDARASHSLEARDRRDTRLPSPSAGRPHLSAPLMVPRGGTPARRPRGVQA